MVKLYSRNCLTARGSRTSDISGSGRGGGRDQELEREYYRLSRNLREHTSTHLNTADSLNSTTSSARDYLSYQTNNYNSE